MGNYDGATVEALGRRLLLENEWSFNGYLDDFVAEAVLDIAKKWGGKDVEVPLAATPVSRTQNFVSGIGNTNNGWTPSANDTPNNADMAKWEYYNFFTACVLDEIEMDKCKTEDQLKSYLTLKLQLPAADHMQHFSSMLISADGTDNDIEGFLSMLSEDGNDTYAGLLRRDFPALIANVFDAANVASFSETNLASGNDLVATKFSNIVTISGDVTGTSGFADGVEVVISDSNGVLSTWHRTVVHYDYNTTNTGKTTIWFNQVMPTGGSYDTATIRDKFYSTSLHGDANVWTPEKIDEGLNRCNGKVKELLMNGTDFGKLKRAQREHVQVMTEEQRKSYGVKGWHKTMNYDGAMCFVSDHIPNGTTIGTNMKSLRAGFLNGYDEVDFTKNDKVLNLWPGGQLAVKAKGYMLCNVFAFGSEKLNEMFIVKNANE